MIFREATPADARSIANVRIKSGKKAFKSILPSRFLNLKLDEEENRYKNTLEESGHEGWCFFVAETTSGEIVGYAYAGYSTYRGPKGNQYPHEVSILHEIFVLPNFKRQKIGIKLFQKVVSCLPADRYSSLVLWALKRTDAENWYKDLKGEYLEARGAGLEGFDIDEHSYGWPKLSDLAQLLNQIL